jgi:hypothetical protein
MSMFFHQQSSDEKSTDHKKDVDTNESTMKWFDVGVVQQHQDDCYGAYAV